MAVQTRCLIVSILDAINEWIKEILIGAINGNLSTMFGDVNEKVGTIAAEVGQTPQGWNANIFSMIQTLSENVIVPIAGLVITYVLCYELISMVTEKNNMHDVDTSMFFKWVFKAYVAVYLVTHPAPSVLKRMKRFCRFPLIEVYFPRLTS